MANDKDDPGRLATPDEASNAWAEVMRIMETIKPWNLPKAAEHIQSVNPSAEAVALGFFALDVLRRNEARLYGAQGGKAGGFKGGRPSKKPPRVELRKLYEVNLAACGSDRQARAQLVKQLHSILGVSLSAVRKWLSDAGI